MRCSGIESLEMFYYTSVAILPERDETLSASILLVLLFSCVIAFASLQRMGAQC